jgi:hypothetical protein
MAVPVRDAGTTTRTELGRRGNQLTRCLALTANAVLGCPNTLLGRALCRIVLLPYRIRQEQIVVILLHQFELPLLVLHGILQRLLATPMLAARPGLPD